jgi:predicted DNA-binding helix-hairpin-helix protein
MVRVARILREDHLPGGYIHLELVAGGVTGIAGGGVQVVDQA